MLRISAGAALGDLRRRIFSFLAAIRLWYPFREQFPLAGCKEYCYTSDMTRHQMGEI